MCRVANDTLKNYGIFLMALGMLGILFGCICFGVCLSGVKWGAGPLWCGIFVICTGLCAYKGGTVDPNESNRTWVGWFLTLDIISIVLSFAAWCLAIAAVADDNTSFYVCHNYGRNGCQDSLNDYWWYGIPVTANQHSASLGINSINLIIAFVQFIVTFTFSIVGCCILCSTPPQRQTVIYQAPAGTHIVVQQNAQMVRGSPAQVIIMGQGAPQQMQPYPGQAYMAQPYQVQPQQQGVVYPAQQQQAGMQAMPQPMPQPMSQPMSQAAAAQMQPTAPPQYSNDPPPVYEEIPPIHK